MDIPFTEIILSLDPRQTHPFIKLMLVAGTAAFYGFGQPSDDPSRDITKLPRNIDAISRRAH